MTNIEGVAIAEHETRFRKDLQHIINLHSRENGSATPDFILAEYLADCLAAYDKAVTLRIQWYAPKTSESDTPFGPAPPEGSGPTDEERKQGEEDAAEAQSKGRYA